MFYLSQLLKSKIIDTASRKAGTIEDIIADGSSTYPPIKALVIKDKKVNRRIPLSLVEDLGGKEAHLKILAEKIKGYYKLGKSDICLKKDILDKQIIDVKGIRVVRVNDIQIRKINDDYRIIGLDVSIKGLLRRLGFASLDVANRLSSQYIDWKDVTAVNGNLRYLQLSKSAQDLVKLHPSDLANIIEDLNTHQGAGLMQILDREIAAKVVEELSPDAQEKILDLLNKENRLKVITKISTNDLVDIIQRLPKVKAEELLAILPDKDRSQIITLLGYDKESAGGLMHLEFISVPHNFTVAEIKQFLKEESHKFYNLLYIYVTDGDLPTSKTATSGRLKGVISLRNLLLALDNKKAKDIMKVKMHTIQISDSYKEVVKILTRYNLFCVAVCDHDKRIVGIINVDDIMRTLVPEA